VAVILDFLQEPVDLRQSYSSVKLRLAAVRNYLDRSPLAAVVQSKQLDDFLKGAQNLAPIPERSMYIWDAERLISCISHRPLPDELLDLAREALILLLLATGIRVDDAYKLGLQMTAEPAVLHLRFLEKRKLDSSGRKSMNLDLARLHSSKPDPTVARLCPVEALHRYLRRATEVRIQDDPFLFISKKGIRAEKATLRRWVLDVFGWANIKAPPGSVRSATTSQAVWRGISIDQVLKSAGWTKECTFSTYYRRPIREKPTPFFAVPELPK
jgi:site-specific recombinase XerD